MQVTSKEYENVLDVVKLRQEMAENKNTSNPVNKRNTEIKPIFKWIALTIFITIFLILVTVPTALVTTGEMDKLQGVWSNWTSFSPCSHSCGSGTQYRYRMCESPSPDQQDMWCLGNQTDIQTCNTEPCPDCSQSCGDGEKSRRRQCDSPSPSFGGNWCEGSSNETEGCYIGECPVHGGWGSWTEISECSHTCGGGSKYRLRMCNDPGPSYGGNWCSGHVTEKLRCNTNTCPEYKSAFTAKYPQNGPTSGTIKFSTVITNIGGQYKPSTGQFICDYPGIYVFSVHIYKSATSAIAYCNIRLNGSNKVTADSDPDNNSEGGYEGGSNTVVLHLSRGDRVDLGSCTSASNMYNYSSFSGFLLRVD